ncbi:STN and carboxypeptidase regulatory-like domain-containing protein [Dyadobacter fanqingshengii]|uniref:Carboxypeptidase-like regulatory domain-containing protein n=1 Tax=Dyadobacter fanqingshengii TaxID=2906443 RepID=A0A9X1P954_9BACT|nr:STN and carboxypeptidase regulatory-like domain-containing protein [Dyadobacter fanqingshengii]MCF0039959.1 carboxypeptidase-like regulatory domain-containing protein [Dyadobacter fanqingshengii]USJ38285.1 carboxypeptidase-like regulatory domain-containing protein [Dyadobacter fanqingshengii]
MPCAAYAQGILSKTVTVSAQREPVSTVLKAVSDQGKFYFSYNSNIISGDSLVTLNAPQQTVKQVLDQLFGSKYQYREKGDYLIILPAAREKVFYISGHIFDQETQVAVDYASIYSRQLLVSTLSDDAGHFRLRIKDRTLPLSLTISKVGYGDTTIVINQESADMRINILQKAVDLDPLIVRYSEGESTWLGRFFLSAKLRAQSRNIGRFFVALPYQASLTPGLGTHGRMSSQVVNKFSLNLLGGYTAGVNGAEIAGGFNISKQDVRYAQLAGAFNVVSGDVTGVQLAGFLNHILDSLSGVQLSGFGGIVKKNIQGVQVSGFASRAASSLHGVQVSGAWSSVRENVDGVQVSGGWSSVRGDVDGAQVAGAYSHTSGNFSGLQIAGGLNVVQKDFSGGQISGGINVVQGKVRGFQFGVWNAARRLSGTQLGVINVADSSSGLSLGLINIIRKSTSNISVYANEITPVNVAWKMGTHKFYSILMAGTTTGGQNKVLTFGAGIGKEFFPFKKFGFFTEILNQNIYTTSWENMPFIYRFQTAVTYKLNKRLMLFAGPSFTIYDSDGFQTEKGYKSFPPKGYPDFGMANKDMTSWIGWQGGLSWRYGKF